uniref:NADH dehydrogenase [ubiquinone] 1 beta subcomplex subunit 4 n=1 Tax=Crocodylus porosus TaxID=8502 RepID=A0A7M4E5J0_CROPO
MADSSRLKGVGYKPLVGVSLPRTLDPAEYQQSEQTRQQQAERLAIRARLKLQYQLKLNDPHRQGLIAQKEKEIKEGKHKLLAHLKF